MSEERAIKINQKWLKPSVFIITVIFHVILFLVLNFNDEPKFDESKFRETKVFKLVDVQEFTPPPETSVREVEQQPLSEKVQETEEKVIEKQEQEEYFAQNQVSSIPVLPARAILSRLEYPKMAKSQGIEGVVLLEMFIDKTGKIQKINVLKDPGYGFAEAAVKAISGVKCVPALINGKPCAVRFRYPVRFKLN